MSKKGNNEGSIRKRPNGKWEARYTDGRDAYGKQIQRSIYGNTRKEVSEKLNTILQQKQSGFYVQPTQMRLQDWLIQWLASYAQTTVRPSTYISYEGYVYNHIIPQIGELPIQQITPAIVQTFYNQKFESGRTDGKGGLSAKTLRNLHNMFHHAMEQACINGLILRNPTDGTVIPKQQKQEIRVLSPDEEMRLLQAAPSHRLGFAIILDLATGLRIGELCALKWTDVNFQTHTLKISRTLQRVQKNRDEKSSGESCTVLLEGSVKTNNGYRKIPILDSVFAMLLCHKEQQNSEKEMCCGAYTDNGYIFAMPTGSCVEPSTMRDALNVLLEHAGIPHINFHALRHTFATRAIENGMDPKTLSTILGHATVQLTMDLYCHSSLEQMRCSMEKLAVLF